MPTEQQLLDNPFKTYSIGDGYIVWYDTDLGVFLVSPEGSDGCDEAEEFETFQDAISSLN